MEQGILGILDALNTQIGSQVVAIPASVLWAAFGVALGFFAFMAGVLLFHWSRYGYKSGVVRTARVIFFLGALVFFANAAVSIVLMT